jgi:hypothetical protein
MSTTAFYRISGVESLRGAWKAINKDNIHSKGIDDFQICQFKAGLERNLAQISLELRSNAFSFHKLRAHAMEKPLCREEAYSHSCSS